MITLLSKLLIKDSYSEAKKRGLYGTICGGVGIFLNIILFMGKLFAGVISGSIAITADAFNNLSDAGSSIVTLIGFKLAGQKPDKKHPYGHGRMEYIAGLIVSGIIIIMSYELCKDSIAKIIHPSETEFNFLIAGILLASILVKCYMAFYNTRVGNAIQSATLKAIAMDSLTDCIATSLVLISGIVSHFTSLQIDGFAGLFVAFFVFMAGYGAMKETVDPLLGVEPDPEFMQEIADFVTNYDTQLIGVHDLLVHDYGPGRKIISLHAEVPAEGDVLSLHDVIDNVEHALNKEYNCLATIHMDPVVTKDPRVSEMKGQVKALVKEIDERLSIHDFRVVFGETHTNLIFDMVVPYDVNKSDSEIELEVIKKIRSEMNPSYFAVIDIDKI